MPAHRLLVTLLVLIFFLVPLSGQLNHIDGENREIESAVEEIDRNTGVQRTNERSIVAADPISGVLDTVAVEQYGYKGTGLVNARTDSRQNDECVIPIDNATGWVGSQAELEVWNMERLYAENGTLDDGISGTNYYPSAPTAYPYGWSLDWDDPSSGLQNVSATYDKENGYLVLQSKAELAAPPPTYIVEYRHWDGTYIYWNQTIHNIPYSDNLTLSFMYNYDSGIIDNPPLEVAGWLWLDVLIDGAFVAYIDLMTECPSRNTWYEFVVPNLLDLPSTFNLQIGISVEAVTPPPADYFVTNPGADYDGDSELDLGLAQINRVLLDNISLLSSTQPSYEAINLSFNAGTFSTAVIEFTNYGTATITNPGYWSDNTLAVGISSNVSISCNYEVKLLSHNFGNSLWAPQPTRSGVAYSIDAGESASLTTFTYVGNEGVAIYENFTVELYLPRDWENATIYDPFLNDVTSQCSYIPGLLEIPTSLLNRLGWWQIALHAPNYAKSVKTQILDSGLWYNNTLFRPNNFTRVTVALGTIDQIPIISNPVNVTYYQSDASVWYEESIGLGTNGKVNSTQQLLSGSTTLAGEWTVVAAWSNGSEVAYDAASFEMYHTASLVVPAEYTTIQTDVGLIISNFVYFTDVDTSDFLLDDSVTIKANWSSLTVPFTQDFVKNWWRGEFDTSLVSGGQYTVLLTASRPYFDNVSTQFIVIATQKTTLEILNAGAIPIDRGLNEVFTVQMDYELLNGTGILGADIDVSHSGPGGGLSWDDFVDYNNGHYSVDIRCDISATYPVTITLNKSYHKSASDSFTLIIGETHTSFTSLNGTADVVLFGGNYTLVLEYLNSTGGGLLGANLQVVKVTPTMGLIYSGFSNIADGFYQINLTPTEAGSFSIVISASIANHETQYATFTLTATGIPTILTSSPSSASIALDQNFTVQLTLQDESLDAINGANFTVTYPSSGIIISDLIPSGNGLYNYTLTPMQIGTYHILFRSSVNNYQSSSAAFTLIVTEIETRIEFAGGVSSALVEFQESYQLIVYYYRTDLATPTNVNGANVSVFAQDFGLNIVVDEAGGYYLITIRGQAVGTWSLTISANKTDHYIATKQFLFEVVEIDTSIEGSNPLESLFVGRSYLFNFTYMIESNSSHVFGADITPLGEGADWISVVELGNGQYSVQLTPSQLGSRNIVLVFEKYGFEAASFRLVFGVSRVPILVEILDGLAGLEKMPTTLRVSITEDDTGNPVTNATVFYRIKLALTEYAEDPVRMTESNIPGIYIATLTMPDADSEYLIQISCEAANYELDEPLTMPFRQTRSFTSLLIVYSERYWWMIFGIVAIVGALGYRRSARKRRIRQNKITLAIKKRFDDVKSLLGVIVLHKDSGLPVYSKILREGLEESVISAFIAAITSFRGEFDIETTTEEWGLIPISDIVRVVSTNKLICAFITTSNPSPEQRERMIKFAKTVGFIFDETMEDVPVVVLNQHTTKQFNSLFDDILDGSLLRIYKLDEAKKFQTTTCADERIARKHGEEFKLEELASEIAACGLEEGRVYQAIMRALENHYLVATDESPFATKIIRAPDTVAEEG